MLVIMLMIVVLMIIYNIKILMMITHVDEIIDDHSGIYLFILTCIYFSFSIFSPQWDDETGKVMRFYVKVNSAIKIEILICCPYTFPIEVEGRNNC